MSDAMRGLLVLSVLTLSLPAVAQEPLSASDWLSGSVRTPPRESSAWRPGSTPPSFRNGKGHAPIPPVSATGAVGKVAVSRLDRVDPDAMGISARDARLPADLWAGSEVDRIAELIAQTPARLPAMVGLLRRLLSAQIDAPPMRQDQHGILFMARADRLLGMGDVASARALLTAAGPAAPEIFRRLFDIALLEGDESQACDLMGRTPGIAPSFAARIFCLAQSGDWSAAALSLHGAEALGLIAPDRMLLLRHFLDDSYIDQEDILVPPEPVTPLDFRMHEAIGQPLPTPPLPLAFAQSDLRENTGWKARLEAAERLARAGAIPAAHLRRIYGEQKPAASGGVWDRANALRALEAGLLVGRIDGPLPDAFDEFARADMGGVLAMMMADDIAAVPVSGRAAEIAGWLQAWVHGSADQRAVLPDQPLPPLETPETAPTDRKGEALLAAMADVDSGLDGDQTRAARGLSMLRALGLTAEADHAEIQLRLAPTMLGRNG